MTAGRMPDAVPVTVNGLRGRSVLDSRGYPTVEVDVRLDDGTVIRATSPAGASTGAHEAVERRDHGPAQSGRGVDSAVAAVNGEIAALITGRRWDDIGQVDRALADLDGTTGYSRLGANAIVAVSIAAARAFAHAAGLSLHSWLARQSGSHERLPVPHFNVVNGGAHAQGTLALQEFMVAPVGAASEEEAVRIGAEVHHALADLMRDRFGGSGVGDEGGFAPQIADPRIVLDMLVEAITAAGHTPGADGVAIALDPAANGFHLGGGRYRIDGVDYDRDELVGYYLDLIDIYPIRSLEDGFAEDDPDGWAAMMRAVRGRVQIVGDDLFVTDPERIRDGHDRGYADAVLIKPNQIGTVSQTLEAIATARARGMACMISHRSGETGDTFIADLAVGTGVGQIKAGAPVRGERVAKYNRLTEIELDHPDLPYGLA